MQPDNIYSPNENNENTQPTGIPTPSLVVTPPEFNGSLEPKPNKKKRLLIYGLVAVLLLVMVGVGLALVNKSKENTNTSQKGNGVTGDNRSIFAYIDGANDIQGADFEINADAPKEHSALPFLTAKGKIVRDSETGELHARLPIDKDFTQVKIDELKKIIDYENREHQADYKISDNYEIDMAGLLSKLNIMPASKQLNFGDKVTQDFQAEAPAQKKDCQAATDTYEKLIKDELNALQPNYQMVNKQETKWEIEFASVSERLVKQVDIFFEACTGDKQKREADYLNNDKLTFITKRNDSNIEFKVVLEDRTYSDNTQEYIILTATLSNIKAKGNKVKVATSPSVFSLDNTSAYIIAINKCKNLPFIAGGGLFGSYDYVSPDSTSYSGPSLFDTGYFCTAKEAKSAGYDSDTDR